MRAGEMVRKLKKQGGWYISEHGSEHDLWSNDECSLPFIALPRHWSKELSKKVENDFNKAMREIERKRKEKKDD